MGNAYAGTSWEGVRWRTRAVPQPEAHSFFDSVLPQLKPRTALALLAVLVPLLLGIAALLPSTAGAYGCSATALYPSNLTSGTGGGGKLSCAGSGQAHSINAQLKEQRGRFPDAVVAQGGKTVYSRYYTLRVYSSEQRGCFYSVAWTGRINDGSPVRCI